MLKKLTISNWNLMFFGNVVNYCNMFVYMFVMYSIYCTEKNIVCSNKIIYATAIVDCKIKMWIYRHFSEAFFPMAVFFLPHYQFATPKPMF